jgi:hypothetical protein
MIEQIKAKIGQYRLARTLQEVNFEFTSVCALDIESTGHDRKVGDAPYCPQHGVAGIALGNLAGDAVYLIVNDGRDYGGISIQDAIQFLNQELHKCKIVTCHYSKFDLGFLQHRGLNINGTRVIDTWLLSNIQSEGIYSANKLKDIVRTKLGITTNSEADKDAWMEQQQTRDYGDVPVEIMGRYACDDVKYSLLTLLMAQRPTDEDWACHDLYSRNIQHLMKAERRGVLLDMPLLKKRLQDATEIEQEQLKAIRELLGSAEVQIEDDQSMLQYLNAHEMHPAPRQNYGTLEFVYDEEFLRSVDHDLALAYRKYHKIREFRLNFSADGGVMGTRVFVENGNPGFHVQHLPSIFSKGGLVFVVTPNFRDRVKLVDEVRALFQPRPGHVFCVVQVKELFYSLLAYYCQDQELLAAVPQGNFLALLATRTGHSPELCRAVLQQLIEGHGMELLARRIKLAGIKGVGDKKSLYRIVDKVKAWLGKYGAMEQNLKAQLQSAPVNDRLGRRLRIPPEKHWRAVATLLGSSHGSILSFYLDLFCRVAEPLGAQLLLVHENEMVFEAPTDKADGFVQAVQALQAQPLVEPVPFFTVKAAPKWQLD